ncbi:DUF6216 family protein [Morganella morganii]|uniref:DUF6216 family protein n=1 Tax=Morganella morganii TaxID=582 RepID=UPI000F4991F8|nr:DUF6216 family protein [Morganella morganii]ROJ32231.1 hypothetical protein BFD15_08820 [Morganella morganii]
MPISFETSISYVSSIFNKEMVFILCLSITIGLFYYIRKKSKSGFSVVRRIWRVCIGFNYKDKNDFINDILEIEEFNYYYNTSAVSKRQKKKFQHWVRKFELDFKLISKLKSNLCIERLKIKKINKILFFSLPVEIAFLLTLVFIPVLNIAVKPAGLVSINNSEWFLINKDGAREYQYFGGDTPAWIINKDNCLSPEEIKSTLDKDTVTMICNTFDNKSDQDYLVKLIKEQRLVYGFLAITILLVSVFRFKYMLFLSYTLDARKMLFNKIKLYKKRK